MKSKPLSVSERERVWNSMRSDLTREPARANTLLSLTHKPMVPALLAIVLFLSGSVATVAAADNAKPGDTLFPLDRAIEKIQISLSSDEKKDELKIKFALERVEEIEEVIEEVDEESSDNSDDNNNTSATSTDDAIDDSGATSENKIRLEAALNIALEYIGEVKKELYEIGNEEAVAAIDQVIDRLNTNIVDLPEKLKLEVKSDENKDKIKLEIKTDEGKEKFEFQSEGDKYEYESEGKDGKVKIKVEDDGRIKIEQEDEEDEDAGDDSGEGSDRLSEVEIKIFSDQTLIKVEFNDKKYILTATSTDRDTLVDIVADRFDVPREDVERELKIESEDHEYEGSTSGNSATSTNEDLNDEDDENHNSSDESDEDLDDDSDDSSYELDDSYNAGSSDSSNDDSDDDKDNASDSSSNDEEDEDSGNNSGTTSQDLREAEAEVKGSSTEIKVKIGEQEYKYYIISSDRNGVVNDISTRYSLDKDLVDQKLKYEIKTES